MHGPLLMKINFDSPHGNAVFYAPEKRMNEHQFDNPMVFYTKRVPDENEQMYFLGPEFAQKVREFGRK